MDCDFMIRSEDKDQLINLTQQHVKETHNEDFSASDIEALIKTV